MNLPTTTARVMLFCALFSLFCCNKKEAKDYSVPSYIPRNSYFVDNYQGVKVYRDNISREPLDGYFIVGNETTKWEEFRIKEGLLFDDYIFYHQNGEKFMQSKYRNGKLNGEEKTFFPSGKLKKISKYVDGKLDGKAISYFESGQVLTESEMKDDKPLASITYNDKGDIESRMFIVDGKSITQTLKDGKVFKEQISSIYDSFEGVKFYNEDSSMKIYLRMIDEGKDTFLVELNEKGEEIKRINFATNPREISKYRKYISSL
ncbi:toxin-antitoxin system YwqK family antitoxin [Flavivirga eckloniae]|uniref:Toxin-antitoxin system YwqK family antitoxin n=1 Tax=Flavivirga eckloniae TaxID=1803846 RepID=A0A2K9PR62_9FLAO|nr:hypothetical protein [Flavivirga eckloniae]AUP79560.1 hypothetical protein C1H87_12910 [Flavivirga eckloniae]